MSNELKDCPFCGSTADVQSDFGVDHWVQCTNLHCGAVDGTIYNSAAPAIEHWNRRPALAASGGNAAPGLTDERAAFEADTLDLYPVATFNRFPNSENYNVNWVQEQWGGWQRRAKYAAASAPNAALVALKEALDLIRLEVADGVHTEEYRRGMAALSAAGQEVGK